MGVESRDADVQQADHVVGVDESGNGGGGPFVMVAVQCPRERGEDLAELLIDLDLQPWKNKSSSTPSGMTNADLSSRVRDLIDAFRELPVTWHAVAGWGDYNKDQRGMIACIVTSKAMTGGSDGELPEYTGPATLLHDGGRHMYGTQQIELRRAAARQFSGFGDRITPLYLSNLKRGDKTYPEITAADYIAGYLNSQIPQSGIEGLGCDVQRIDNSWRASDEAPTTLYQLRARNRRRQLTKEDRAAAWIEGCRPPEEGAWNEQPLESLADRLRSETVRNYLLDEL
jgi:hypothetical protein